MQLMLLNREKAELSTGCTLFTKTIFHSRYKAMNASNKEKTTVGVSYHKMFVLLAL